MKNYNKIIYILFILSITPFALSEESTVVDMRIPEVVIPNSTGFDVRVPNLEKIEVTTPKVVVSNRKVPSAKVTKVVVPDINIKNVTTPRINNVVVAPFKVKSNSALGNVENPENPEKPENPENPVNPVDPVDTEVVDPMKGYVKGEQDKFDKGLFTGNANSDTTDDMSKKIPSGMRSMWELSLSALFVLALLCGFLFLLRKYGAKYVGVKTDDIIRITSKVQIDSKNTLLMLRVYEDEILVGVGQNGIQLLSRFNQIENEDDLIAEEKAAKSKEAFEKALTKEIEVEDVK